MAYREPTPRYKKYTKGFEGESQMPRGTVEYTRFGTEYFSGANVGIYFGDVLVDEIFGLQFQLQEQILPVYGYGSYVFDAVAKGQRIINGSFSMYFKESAYLSVLLRRLNEEFAKENATLKGNPFKYDTQPEEVTIERIIDQLSSKSAADFDRLAESYEKSIWGPKPEGEFADQITGRGSGPFFTPLSYTSLNDRGFDIVISYGPEARRQAKSITGLSPNTTVESINCVHLSGVSKVIDASGQPIYETYTFIAKDMNNNIHQGIGAKTTTESVIQKDYPTIRMGDRGEWVKVLQRAINAWFASINDKEKEILKKLLKLSNLSVGVDGVFGTRTKEAVEAFQSLHKLTTDGVVGPQTWNTLLSENYINAEV